MKLLRIERTSEQTGHPNCPLVRGQRPMPTFLTVATEIHTIQERLTVQLTTGVYPIDYSSFKAKRKPYFKI